MTVLAKLFVPKSVDKTFLLSFVPQCDFHVLFFLLITLLSVYSRWQVLASSGAVDNPALHFRRKDYTVFITSSKKTSIWKIGQNQSQQNSQQESENY